MAGKSDISAAPGVQNVLVYVSNDNFAQAYAVGQPPPQSSDGNQNQPADYNNHVEPTKLKDFPAVSSCAETSGGYYLQNFYQHHHQQQNGDVDRNNVSRVRDECVVSAPPEQPNYEGYVTVMGAEGPPHSVRCDSVRSETAESSCSSLSSSTDESMLLVQNHSDMIVYDNGAGVRQNSVVFTVGTAPQTVTVPHGWKRILNQGSVIYISPSNTALSSPEQVKEYLLTAGTCKCGLECHFKYDNTFNFDPKVGSKPWTFTPDTNTGDLTKLCNHKRKMMAMSPFDGKPPNPNNIIKMRKDGSSKKSKRKIGLPYPGCVSLSPTYQRSDKMFYGKENQQNQPQMWPPNNRLPPSYQDGNYQQPMVRYQGQDVGVDNQMMGPQQPQQQPNISHNATSNIRIHQHHVLAPNGHVISVQPVNSNQPQQVNISSNGVIQGQNVVPNQQSHQQRLFVNNQPHEPSGPGRPNLEMIPIGMSQQQQQDRMFANAQQAQQYQYEVSKMRPAFIPNNQMMNGYRPQNIMINNIQQQQQWNSRMPIQPQQHTVQNQQMMPNQYDNRVPPLHQHPPPMWQEEIKRKKIKLNKQNKNRQYHMMECQNMQHVAACPNIDVRQIPNDNGRQIIVNPMQGNMTSSPSFMEDPSGYLAQQTALLNNTINRQTGVNGCPMVCNNEIPLPSNVMVTQMKPNRSNQKPQAPQQYNSQIMADSSEQHINCQGCLANKMARSNTPSSSTILDDPVTSSNYSDKQGSPDSRPIQGGTVSTSNVSPIMEGSRSNPSTPNPHTPTPPSVFNPGPSCSSASNYACCSMPKATSSYSSGVVTAMASGRTIGSNTITSVLAGRANTATVSINNPAAPAPAMETMNVSKSPLEMVQSVVSSIQMPPQSPNILKHSPTGLPPGHILVSSGGQLIMANTGVSQSGVMPPPPPKLVTNQVTTSAMPPISVSPMVTNVTAAVSQVIPAVAQQVLGQQTVLVNALPAPFVLQPGVTMTMDGVVGQNVQLPLVAGNVIQQPIQIESGNDPRRATLMSPESTQKKKGKKRKVAGQTVANMLQIAQQNPGVVMSQPSFPQQIQMAHSPQGLMQALTIVPSKNGGQILMNGQASPMINSQPTQQINLLQPVNLINGTTGMMQNFPTIQQFIVPNLGGMVMNPDGTATLLQDTSNLGMQLQLQNVNGQNVLTPVQSTGMFNSGQSILTASPAGMVIRAPANTQGKIIQQQQHSPGQFLSPNGGQFVVNGQFGGQLSPLVANVSPNFTTQQQIRPQQPPQEYIQCNQMGQTLMVPCTPTPNIAVSSANQNTATFVQQNTTIVQQQTTMVSNNQQQLQIQQQAQQAQQPSRSMEQQSFVISSHNDKQQVQAVLVQRESPNNYRQSVSTQTAVNQNAQTVTTFCQTSTLCAGSPPDTTTHSPMASGGQSPPTADTTTHSGSTDDGLSPAPSNCSTVCDSGVGMNRQPSCTMAMVHCISSSEPDSADLNSHLSENDWSRLKPDDIVNGGQIHFTDNNKKQPGHLNFAESSTMVHLIEEQKGEETVVSSHNYDKMVHHHHHHHHHHHNQKRKSSDALLVMETNNHNQMHSSSIFDEDVGETRRNVDFVVGDLVWGPSKMCASWPGKITEIHDDEDKVTVRWFGNEKLLTKVTVRDLQTLTEGLDAHHRARKKCRTSRKLSSHLEKAIQEAMAELDKEQEPKKITKTQKKPSRRSIEKR